MLEYQVTCDIGSDKGDFSAVTWLYNDGGTLYVIATMTTKDHELAQEIVRRWRANSKGEWSVPEWCEDKVIDPNVAHLFMPRNSQNGALLITSMCGAELPNRSKNPRQCLLFCPKCTRIWAQETKK